jgi:hypothetical protein
MLSDAGARRHRPSRALGAAGLLAALLAAPAPARAWDDVGHMAVAIIAWRHMTPLARERAAALLRGAPPDAGLSQLRPNAGGPEERDLALFARAATWPDLVRDRRDYERFRTYHRATWHYLSAYWRAGAGGRAEPVTGLPVDAQNIAERIPVLRVVAADPSQRAESRAVALAWVLHLVGDVHQPLHTASRVTPEHPEGDRGGNLVKLGSTNLHSVWDDLFDVARVGVRPDDPGRGRRSSRRGAAAPRGADARLARAAAVADEVAAAAPMERMLPQVVEGRVGAWIVEGTRLAQSAAYTPDLVDGGSVPPGYRERARRAAAPQLALAGYRLASLLNAALDGAPAPAPVRR